MARHERIAVYANHLHTEEYEIIGANGITVLNPIWKLTADPDGYHEARLLGAWVGNMWLPRTWFVAAEDEDHVFKVEGLIGDQFDRGKKALNEPAIGPGRV